MKNNIKNDLKNLLNAIKEAEAIINIDEDMNIKSLNIKKIEKEIITDKDILILSKKYNERENVNDK